MNKELVVDVRPSEINIALLEDKQLVELHQERSDASFAVGNVYLGRVKKVMPGLNAAFIDIGHEKDAFLHYQDMGPQFRSLQKYLQLSLSQKGQLPSLQKFKNEPDIDKKGKISDLLSNGQLIVVQIVKEPISTKGPRLTSELSFAGRNIVLMPFHDKVMVSQKIKSAKEKERLVKLFQGLKTKNAGVIIRTAAANQKVEVLDNELRELMQKFEQVFVNARNGKAPRLLAGEINRTSALLRDLLNDSFTSIYVNDAAVYHDIRDYIAAIAPDKQHIVKLYQEEKNIFEHFGIDKAIKALFGKTVSVKTGAYLVIEHTEALHVIDVNSGKKAKTSADQETTALETNLAAVPEIARQLRLRDMGGIIVVDFIDMAKNEHRQQVFEKMKEAMASDRARHNILPLSKFGLMQITRQRVRPEMAIDTMEKCPSCNGTGKISPPILLVDEIESRLSSVVQACEDKTIFIKVHPFVAAYLTKGFFSYRFRWGLKFRRLIKIVSSSSMHFTGYRFYNARNEEIKFS